MTNTHEPLSEEKLKYIEDVFSAAIQCNVIYSCAEDFTDYENFEATEIIALIEEVRLLRSDKAWLPSEIKTSDLDLISKLAASEARRISAEEVLKHCDAAMTYAYEDHSDQYYKNVQEQIHSYYETYPDALR